MKIPRHPLLEWIYVLKMSLPHSWRLRGAAHLAATKQSPRKSGILVNQEIASGKEQVRPRNDTNDREIAHRTASALRCICRHQRPRAMARNDIGNHNMVLIYSKRQNNLYQM